MSNEALITACYPLAHQYAHLIVHCPALAPQALPGQYVNYGQAPLYIMGQTTTQLEFIISPTLTPLFSVNQKLSFSDLQGVPLAKPNADRFHLLICQDQELNAGLFYCKKYHTHFKGFVLIGAQQYFPFLPRPSQHIVPELPSHVIATLPLLEDWGIANRLSSQQEQPGVFWGSVQEMAAHWLQQTLLSSDVITVLRVEV